MGHFYVSLSVRTPDREALLAALPSGDPGVIGPPDRDWLFLSTEALETQDPGIIDRYGTRLSAMLGVPVVGVLNHDDDILQMYLYEGGARTAFFDSDPGNLTGEDRPAILDNLAAFAALGETASEEGLREAVTSDHVFASELHRQIAFMLGLPMHSVGFGHSAFAGFTFFD